MSSLPYVTVDYLNNDAWIDTPIRWCGLVGRAASIYYPTLQNARNVGLKVMSTTVDNMGPSRVLACSHALTTAYVITDLFYVTYRTLVRNGDRGNPSEVLRTFCYQASFHALATLYIPAVIINNQMALIYKLALSVPSLKSRARSITRYSSLAVLPLLPFILDSQVEKGLGMVFRKFWGTDKPILHRDHTGHGDNITLPTQTSSIKEI